MDTPMHLGAIKHGGRDSRRSRPSGVMWSAIWLMATGSREIDMFEMRGGVAAAREKVWECEIERTMELRLMEV